MADLGIAVLRCDLCLRDDVTGRIRFAVEPTIAGVHARGPAAGHLREGDMLVAVGGELITSEAGAGALLDLRPGDRIQMTVRRAGELRQIGYETGTRCLAAGDQALPIRLDGGMPGPAISAVSPAPVTGTAGGFGAAFWCTGQCSQMTSTGTRAWAFTAPPEIAGVRPGSPADLTGLRQGDRVLFVNRTATTTPTGTEWFLTLGRRSGAELQVQRGNTRLTLTVP